MAKSKESVHVGLEYNEAVSAKKEILLCETGLLEIIKRMRAYKNLRNREFILKNRIQKDFATIKKTIIKIEDELPTAKEIGLPELEIADKIKKDPQKVIDDEIEKIEQKRVLSVQKEKNRKIEDELDDIKSKLAQLG